MSKSGRNVSENLKLIIRGLDILYHIEKKYFVYTVLTALATAVCPYIPVYFAAKIIDEVTIVWKTAQGGTVRPENMQRAIAIILWTIALTFLICLLRQFFLKEKELHEQQFYLSEKMMFADKAMDMKYENLENADVSILKGRVDAESQTGYNMWMLHNSITQIMQGVLSMLIAGIGIMRLLFMEGVRPGFKAAFLICILLLVQVNIICDRKQNQLFNHMANQWASLNLWADYYDELLADYHAGKDIRIFGLEQVIRDNYKQVDLEYMRLQSQTSWKQTKFIIMKSVFSLVLNGSAYIYIIRMCAAGNVTVGEISAYAVYIIMFVRNAMLTIKTGQELINNNQYLKRYYQYLDLEENGNDAGEDCVNKGEKDILRNTQIVFRNVSFRYPGTEQFIFQNLNIVLNAGQRIAMVGKNGSGKTTFIKLLCRLYDPTEGEILLNGINIQNYKYDDYIKKISVVFQDFKLLSFPLAQNVAVNRDYNIDRVSECLMKAGMQPYWIKDMGRYLFKNIMDDGMEISGGEAQKVALARAIYKDSEIIILDEPTSAMDVLAEEKIYKDFNEIVGNKTVFFISHRLFSCKFCDLILVFDLEGVVMKGKHEELMADRDGLYYKMWMAQAKYF